MPSEIILKKVGKVFKDVPGGSLRVLDNIDLEVETGEFLVLVGLSGSGKSTLLRIMSGLEKSYDGHLEVGNGTDGRLEMGFVFQQFAIFPWLTVYENIELPLLAKNVSEKVRKEIVLREVDQFGLHRFVNSYPRELSGGMKQRVGLARALAVVPGIVFLDEPFSELDSFTADELRKELLKVWYERKQTIIMVSHMIPEALELADRVGVLTGQPGRIDKIIVNNLSRPRDKRSPEFFKMEDEIRSLIKS